MLSIYKKLWTIQNEIKKVVRREENKFQKYYFFNELQVLKLLKPLLEKYRVAIFLTDDSKEPFFCEQKGNFFLVRYLKRLDIIDVEEKPNNENSPNSTKPAVLPSPDPSEENNKLTYNFWAVGLNQDPAKAKGAAETYAIKYILTKFFLIPVMNINDPDFETKEISDSKLTREDQQTAKEVLKKHGWYNK
jgi:hypothetical protein